MVTGEVLILEDNHGEASPHLLRSLFLLCFVFGLMLSSVLEKVFLINKNFVFFVC